MPPDVPLMTELPIWLQLNKVSKMYMDALAGRLGHLGIRRYYFLLVAISERDGKATQQDLADLLQVDKVSMVGILDSLAKAGFIRRSRSGEDRRKHHVVLTEKARKAIPEIRGTIREFNQRALAGIPAGFRAKFLPALLAMRAELERIVLEPPSSGARAPKPSRKTR